MFKSLPDTVKIVEVGPRDGLQNEKQVITTEDKFQFIEKLISAGHTSVEVTSFVNPKAIPQMSDSIKLAKEVLTKYADQLDLPCLVPNQRGLESAKQVGVKEIAVFSATSNTFNQKNINTDVDGSFERLTPVIKEAKKLGIKVRAYISTAFGCPYEGEISLKQLMDVTDRFLKLSVDEISIGDTTGVAIPNQVAIASDKLIKKVGADRLAMHFHDTRGMALSNILVSLEKGIRIFDSSAGGLGGCPYAKGATGNVATEDVLYLCEKMGVKTSIDMAKQAEAAIFMLEKVGRSTESKFLRAYLNTGKY